MDEEGKQKVTGIRYIRITLLIFVLCNKAEQNQKETLSFLTDKRTMRYIYN